jgi:hypothetical protein
LRHAVRRCDAKTTYFALLDWLQHFEAVAPDHTIEALTAAARDPALDQQIGAIENELFARQPDAERWSPRQLLRRVNSARRGLGGRSGGHGRSVLPEHLNPVGPPETSAFGWRKPAR